MFTHWHEGKSIKKIAPRCDLGTIFTIDGYAFHEQKSFTELDTYLEKLYKENRLKDLTKRISFEGEKIFNTIQKKIKKDDQYIIDNFEEIFVAYIDFVSFWTLVGGIIGNQILLVAKKVGYITTDAELFEKVHPYLLYSWIEDEVADMRVIAEFYIKKYGKDNISNISSIINKDKEILQRLASYMKQYKWSRISKWIGEPIDMVYTRKRLLEEIHNIVDGNYIDQKTKKDIKKADGLISLSVYSAYYRAQATMLEMMMAHRMKGIFSKIAKQNHLQYEDILLLTPQELITLMSSKEKKINNINNLLARRGSFFCTLGKNGQEVVLSSNSKEYAIIYDTYVKKQQSHSNTNVLKGIGASKGKVTGVVRIINSSADFASFKKDEVLVTVETSPTFVPLMRMSCAILTGRGGITSHAAIVSRELGKPCIIAIKDIVKVLKDGDLVEVDADKGIVRILDREVSNDKKK